MGIKVQHRLDQSCNMEMSEADLRIFGVCLEGLAHGCNGLSVVIIFGMHCTQQPPSIYMTRLPLYLHHRHSLEPALAHDARVTTTALPAASI